MSSTGYKKQTVQGFLAGADLSALKNTFVKFSGTDQKTVVGCGSGENPCGVLLNSPTSGQMAEVCTGGGCELKAGGTIDPNASIGSGALGVGAAITSGAAFAVADAGAVIGDIFPIHIELHTGRAV
jgi:hypothetical protein